jgi:hypothetical protein
MRGQARATHGLYDIIRDAEEGKDQLNDNEQKKKTMKKSKRRV